MKSHTFYLHFCNTIGSEFAGWPYSKLGMLRWMGCVVPGGGSVVW